MKLSEEAMTENIINWATVISAICAVIGVFFLFAQSKQKTSTTNQIVGGSRNLQVGESGNVKNSIINGDDNEQRS